MFFHQGSTWTSFRKNNGKFEDVDDENSKRGLLNYLVRKSELAGHQLSFEEAKADPEMISPNEFAFYFGSFLEAAEQAWDQVRHAMLQMENEQKGNDGSKLLGGNEYMDSKANRRGKQSRYSIAELKFKLKQYFEQNGRLPTQAEVCADEDLPSYATLIKHLGPRSSWDEIVRKKDSDDVPADTDISNNRLCAGCEEDEKSIVIDTSSIKKELSDDSDEQINTSLEQEGPSGEEDLKVETVKKENDGIIKIEMKISVPDREKPIFITLGI